MIESLIFLGVVAFFVFKTVRIVPQQSAYVVERLGQYNRTLNAGMHIVVPFVDSIRYRHSLKELVIDVPDHICVTKDNVQVRVDGLLSLRVTDPAKASYGVRDHISGVIQLVQTSLGHEMGKLEIIKSFEERDHITSRVLRAIEPATKPWGVEVLRYELKSIVPPEEILDALEKQMRAEREKRAKLLESEGGSDSNINRAEGTNQ